MMIGGVNDLFVDTNILVYANISSSPFHTVAKAALDKYRQKDVNIWISRQVLREYLCVVTRPQSFAKPLSAEDATTQVQIFIKQFNVADENMAVTNQLLDLIRQIPSAGKQIHDANIIATMQTCNVDTLLTYNVSDFTRFSDLITVLPLDSSKEANAAFLIKIINQNTKEGTNTMPKITFIGAGSFGFTRKLVKDVLTFPLMEASTITLMDINAERLDFANRAINRIVETGNYPAKVEATMDRAEALKDADYVVVTILAGGTDIWRHDIELPKQYGVDTNIGDTRGPSGIFRAMRTIPVMLDIAKDMERYCPNALMLNYTNPMVMLCRAMNRETDIQLTGLCHSVQGTAEMLARWIDAPMDEITYTCAGINHMAWYLDYKWKGEDAYPLIHKAITENEDIYNAEQVRNEMYLALDHYVTESSGHNSEYNWWFRKRPDLIEKYCTHGTNWNPGEYAYVVKRYQEREQNWKEQIQEWFDQDEIDLTRGHEYAAYIINAMEGGEPFEFNGNVANKNLITNLPQDACVEVPVWASRKGLSPVAVGALPPQCAMLTNLSAQIEEMAVEGTLSGDPRLIYQAIAHDPLTASVLSLKEIQTMVDEMFELNKNYLPTFSHMN